MACECTGWRQTAPRRLYPCSGLSEELKMTNRYMTAALAFQARMRSNTARARASWEELRVDDRRSRRRSGHGSLPRPLSNLDQTRSRFLAVRDENELAFNSMFFKGHADQAGIRGIVLGAEK